jgi:hypothetical protein
VAVLIRSGVSPILSLSPPPDVRPCAEDEYVPRTVAVSVLAARIVAAVRGRAELELIAGNHALQGRADEVTRLVCGFCQRLPAGPERA